MGVLMKEIGDICISCTVLPVLGICAVTAAIYYFIPLAVILFSYLFSLFNRVML